MFWNSAWRNILFADEKVTNLEFLDGDNYYWYILMQISFKFFSRKMGDGTSWCGVLFQCRNAISKELMEKLSQTVIKGCYFEILHSSNHSLGAANWKFHQNNAPSHKFKSIKEWLKRENMYISSFVLIKGLA